MKALSHNPVGRSHGFTIHCDRLSYSQLSISPPAILVMLSRLNCPYCSNVLLRHVRSGQIYWRCRHCYQDIYSFGQTKDKANC